MKNFIAAIFIGFVGINAQAMELEANVLVEHSAHVAYAPSEIRGVYKFQILKSGVVRTINNKNEVTNLAKLSNLLVKKLVLAIDKIENDDLRAAQGSECSDAPSYLVEVQTSDRRNLVIWKKFGCREQTAIDGAAATVAGLAVGFQKTFNFANSIN